MVALPEVNHGENGGSLQTGDKIHNVGQGVAVQDGDAVEAAVVAAGTPAAVRLAHHVKRRGPGAVRAAQNAVSLQGGELGLGGGEFLRVQAPKQRGDGRSRGLQVMQNTVGGVGEPLGRVENILELLQKALDCWTVTGGGGPAGHSLAGDGEVGPYPAAAAAEGYSRVGEGRGAAGSATAGPLRWPYRWTGGASAETRTGTAWCRPPQLDRAASSRPGGQRAAGHPMAVAHGAAPGAGTRRGHA